MNLSDTLIRDICYGWPGVDVYKKKKENPSDAASSVIMQRFSVAEWFNIGMGYLYHKGHFMHSIALIVSAQWY